MGRQRLKIILIGPVYPYKGGISHYTGLMFRSLEKEHDVKMLSFSFQYPKLLYKKEQKDYSNESFMIPGTEYGINTANPFNWAKISRYLKKLKPDLIIIQWWHPYFSFCYRAITKRLGDIPVVYICHNVFPHEHFPMDRFLTQKTLAGGSAFVVQSGLDEKDLLSIIPDAVYVKTVHPTYDVFNMRDVDKSTARQETGIGADELVLLFFGFVREYKGLRYLIEAMPAIKSRINNVRLVIAGDFDGQKEEYMNLIRQNDASDCTDVYDGYIPDKELGKFFAASDLVVLPYVSATQSGVAQIAYGFEKPVLATDVGGLSDAVCDGLTGYLVEPQNPKAIADAVIRFSNDDHEKMISEIRNNSDRFSWDRMTEHINDLYLRIADNSHRQEKESNADRD